MNYRTGGRTDGRPVPGTGCRGYVPRFAGGGYFRKRLVVLSASTLPPVWHVGQ